MAWLGSIDDGPRSWNVGPRWLESVLAARILGVMDTEKRLYAIALDPHVLDVCIGVVSNGRLSDDSSHNAGERKELHGY